MAGKFLTWLFGEEVPESNENQEKREENVPPQDSSVGTTLQDAENFIAELQSYYYNDLQKMRTDLLTQRYSHSEEKFINKKIKLKIASIETADGLNVSKNSRRQLFKNFSASIGDSNSIAFRATCKISIGND